MIYFPYADFDQTIQSFDVPMRKKQLHAVRDVLTDLEGQFSFVKRPPRVPPPSVQAWRGYERALARYGVAICASLDGIVKWRGHFGFAHSDIHRTYEESFADEPDVMPPWWGREDIHTSHQVALATKDKKAIVWPELPVYPEVTNDEQYDRVKAEVKAANERLSELTPDEIRHYALLSNAVSRFVWRSI